MAGPSLSFTPASEDAPLLHIDVPASSKIKESFEFAHAIQAYESERVAWKVTGNHVIAAIHVKQLELEGALATTTNNMADSSSCHRGISQAYQELITALTHDTLMPHEAFAFQKSVVKQYGYHFSRFLWRLRLNVCRSETPGMIMMKHMRGMHTTSHDDKHRRNIPLRHSTSTDVRRKTQHPGAHDTTTTTASPSDGPWDITTWQTLYDPSTEREFYYNVATTESVWEKPRFGKIVPKHDKRKRPI